MLVFCFLLLADAQMYDSGRAPGAVYSYTFEEGQYNYAASSSISGPAPQVMGTLNFQQRRSGDWFVNTFVSRQGIYSTISPTPPELTYVMTSTKNITQAGLNVTFAANYTVTYDTWVLTPPAVDSTNGCTLFSISGVSGPPFLFLVAGAIDFSGSPCPAFTCLRFDIYSGSLDPSMKVGVFIPIVVSTPLYLSVRYMFANNATRINIRVFAFNGTVLYQSDTYNGFFYMPGMFDNAVLNVYQNNGQPPQGFNNFALLSTALYPSYLSDAQLTQNALAGLPNSIPFSRTYVVNGASDTLFAVDLVSFCKSVMAGNMNVNVLALPQGTMFVLLPNGTFEQQTIPFETNLTIYYRSPPTLFGLNITNVTYVCQQNNLTSLTEFLFINLTFTNHPPNPIPPQNSYTTDETTYATVQLIMPADIDGQNVTAVIATFPPSTGTLYQFANPCPGPLITSIVTDPFFRLCVFVLPSGQFPNNEVLPPDSGSGDFYVGFTNFSFYARDSLGARSPNNATVSIRAVNHLRPTNFSTGGFEEQVMQLELTGVNLISMSSQVFNVTLLSLPPVGEVFAGDGLATVGTSYSPTTNFTYVLRTISVGMTSFLFAVIEQDTRAWQSFPGIVQIDNFNTPHQPNITIVSTIPAGGFYVATFNPNQFVSFITVPDAFNWPADRLLHLTINTFVFSADFCFLFVNYSFLVQKNLAIDGRWDPGITYELGTGCFDSSIEVSAPLATLNGLLDRMVIRGAAPIDTNFVMAACLYAPSTGIRTCDPTNPEITFYTIPIHVVLTDAPDNQPTYTIWQWFTWYQYLVIAIGFTLCLIGCASPFINCVWCCTMTTCRCCCRCTRGYICNKCDEGTAADVPALLAENRRLQTELEMEKGEKQSLLSRKNRR
jgi:hypothetical protein